MVLDPNIVNKEQQKFRGDSPDDVCVAVCNSDGSPIAGGSGGGVGDGINFPSLEADKRYYDGSASVSSETEAKQLSLPFIF